MSRKNDEEYRKEEKKEKRKSFCKKVRERTNERWEKEKNVKMAKIDRYIENFEKGHELSDAEREEMRKKCIRKEKNKIAEEEARKRKLKIAAIAVAGVIGIGSFFGGYKSGAANNQLPSGETITEEETDHDSFAESMKVKIESLENPVYQKISSLDSHDEVMEYLTKLCVKAYNNFNDQEIDIDDVTLNVDVPNQRSI